MNRRKLLQLTLASSAFSLFRNAPAMPTPPSVSIANATLAELEEKLRTRALTSTTLTQACLARIARLDRHGPMLHAMLEINPKAEALARDIDARAKPGGGRLFGVPVLIKGNIATADAMHTNAGSFALESGYARRDAHIVTRLREAGAILLGKTNLSEWANFRSTRSVSGWSGVGGLTRNPHVLDRTASGSSSGSAVAVASGMCTVAVGTETDGSIVSPASCNGIVGIKPTVGLVSRDGIIPISHTQDTAGAMGRCVADAATLLAVIAGPDPRDPATRAAKPVDVLSELSPLGLKGKRIGVVRSAFGKSPEVAGLAEQAIAVLRAQGAIIIDGVDLPASEKYNDPELLVLLTEFKVGIANYLGEFAAEGQARDLASLIAFNRDHADLELSEFNQDLFEQADATKGLADAAYLAALATCKDLARTNGIELALARDQLDALVAPTGDPAYPIDLVNGDSSGASFSSPAAVAGLPHVTVPMGAVRGLPVGLSFVGGAYSEAELIGMAYAYESASRARVAPSFLATVALLSAAKG